MTRTVVWWVAIIFGIFTLTSITNIITKNSTVHAATPGFSQSEYIAQATAETADDNPDCVTSSNFVFRWLVCAALDVLFEAIDFVYNKVILSLLEVEPLRTANVAPDSPEAVTYNVWNSFRIIANVGFVIVFLIAIFGHLFSFALTPYELKKIIPRLAIGFIAVQLSWYIVAFTVDAVNVIGAGLRSLMLGPVRGLSNDITLDFESAWQDIGAELGLLGAGIAIWYSSGFISAIPMILFPILMGLVSVFIVLLLRKTLILVLIVAAPLAFVAWILPNTSSLFKKWWSLFTKVLMMYPIIIAFLAAGELFARVIIANNTVINPDGSKSATDPIVSIVGIIAFFAPFFLIPLTFKYAGGAITALSGGISNWGQSLNQRVFGEERDPQSYRGRRAARKANFQRRKKGRLIDASYAYGKGRYNPIRAPGYLLTRFGANMSEQDAASKIAASKRIEDIVQNGRDEDVYAILGDYNIFTGKALEPDAINAAKAKGLDSWRRDPYMVQAALAYSMRKAGSTEEIKRMRENWGNSRMLGSGQAGYGRYTSRAMRNRMWDQAANEHQMDHGDLKYRDPNDNMNIAKNLGYQTRMLKEANDQKRGYDFMKQRQSYWEGLGEVNTYAQQRYDEIQRTGRAMTSEEEDYFRELKKLHTGVSRRQSTGAPISAQNQHMQLMGEMRQSNWFNDGRWADL